jgi:alpha-N-arabinofuranosidase
MVTRVNRECCGNKKGVSMLSAMLALTLSFAGSGSQPLVQNPGFESSPFLAGWEISARAEQASGRRPTFLADRSDSKEGSQSLVIEALDPARAAVTQKIFLPVGSLWKVKAWVKTEGLSAGDQARTGQYFRDEPPAGGFINVETLAGDVGASVGSLGTTPWHEEETTFRVPSPSFINLTLVGTQRGTGRVWFDNVRLEALPTATTEDVRISAERISKRPINAMQQGQFIEILCNLIPSIIAQQVISTSFEAAPPCKFVYKGEIDKPYRPWYPDGAVHVAQYSLDTTDPFNGARSQKIELPVERARAGISQDGFYLKQGVTYKLRLQMRSEGNVRVRAWLHGAGQVIAGPVPLGSAGEKWSAAEGELRAARTINNATLTIDFEGPGTLWLDRVYLIGSDAVLGLWRPDVVAALKALHPGIIRFGGSTVENYEWKGGIGPWDQRQPFTTVWGDLEENFVGDDEFIQLCKYVAAEPLICLRWAGRKPEDAAAEVEYCNGSAETHWGKLRARNGHPEPYGVKYWQIGNEVDAPEYNTSVRAFAEAMRKADPSIKLVSSFPTRNLLEEAGTVFDYLAPHHYEVADLEGEERNFRELQSWISREGGGKDTRVAVTEWNTTAGAWGPTRGILQTLGNALSVSRYLNLLQRHADLVEIANRSNFADSFGSGFIITGPGWIYESPAYYAQELYVRAAGTYPVRVDRSSPLAWYLREPDLSASLSADGKMLRIYSVNSTLHAMSTKFHLEGFKGSVTAGKAYILEDHQHAMTSEVMNARDEPTRISWATRQEGITGSAFEFDFPPLTLTLLELTLGE